MGDDDRVRADEPVKRDDTDDDAGGGAGGSGTPHGVAAAPAQAAARENATSDETAGDGVQFFEGGDGREEARGDMERDG